jgi:hypothetical protein
VVPLFDRWRPLGGLAVVTWDGIAPPAPEVRAGPLWGGEQPSTLSLGALDSASCALRTYVEEVLGSRFPVVTRALYPAFFAITRRAMRRTVEVQAELERPISATAADAILDEAWPAADFADHPHVDIYRAAARRMVRGFVAAVAPSLLGGARLLTVLDPELPVRKGDVGPFVRLDLVAHVRRADGRIEAISFRPESVATGKGGVVNWSALSTKKRLSFVLLERTTPGISPRVYSGVDGALRDFKWSQKAESLPTETAAVLERYDALARLEFSTTVKPFACDRCGTRIGCPHWMGATA